MKNFFFFLAFTYSHFVSSQAVTFEKHYNFGGTNAGYCVQQTMDGGYIVAGVRTLGIGMEEMLLQKVDSLGQTQWIKFFSDGYESEASSVRQTADGGFILTGWTSIDISYHHYIALIKTDSNGDTVWTKRYDGSSLGPGSSCNCGREVAATSDGGYAIVAGMLDQADNLEKILLIKFFQDYLPGPTFQQQWHILHLKSLPPLCRSCKKIRVLVKNHHIFLSRRCLHCYPF